MTREEFFAAKSKGALWDVGVSINRTNPLPLDKNAVFESYDKALEYAQGVLAYPGQFIAVVGETEVVGYLITTAGTGATLVKLAQTSASGDLASDVATLQTQVNALIAKVGKAAAGEEAATGLYKEIADVLAVANAKVASVGATDKSVTVGGTATAPTVKVAISADEGNALSLAADGLKVTIPKVTVPEYSMKKLDAATAGMSASYQLTKDGTGIGAVIDIPKDMMVKSGSVQTYEAGSLPAGLTEAGTYIVLVLNDSAETKLYINVGNLIEYVTSGSAEGDMVFINIDPQTHKVTATITDGTVTEAKLHADVKAKLAKAVSAVQSVTVGNANGTIRVDGEDVAVTGLADAAYATVDSLNETAQGKVDTAKAELLGAEADDNTKETIRGARKLATDSAASALADAKTYVGTEIGKLDVEDTAVAKKFVSAVSETDGKITVERRELVVDDIPNLGIKKISGLQGALDAKQDTVTFDGEYSATNKAATVSTVNSAVAAVVSNGDDKAADDTIKGAKLYADEKATAALSGAKEYADSIVTGTGGVTARVEALEGKVDVAKVSTAIATAKDEAIDAAATDAATKDAALKTAILGEEAYAQTVKSAYELAASKATMTEVEAKDYATKTEAQGYADAKDAAIADAKKAGTDAMTKIGTIPEGATATTAIGYVDEKIAAIPAQTDYTVTCNATTPEGYAKRYTLSQCGSQIVSIDIPSDMVVSSGKVVENPAGQTAGTYIELTLANATKDKIYINVGNLIEYVTGAKAADGIITTAVDDNHVLTATITDGTITKAKLASSVQTSLGKADTAIQQAGLNSALEGYVAKHDTDRLMTAAEGTKLGGIETGAQKNVIETVKVGGTALTVTEKAVDITAISTDLLTQGTEEIIFNCGSVD